MTSTVLALVLRDAGAQRVLRVPLLLDLGFGLVNLTVFLFISRALQHPGATLPGQHTGYFDFVAVGITFMLVVQAAGAQVTARVTAEQRTGTLEMLAAEPVHPGVLALGLAAYPFVSAVLRAAGYLAVLAGLFGLRVGHADWLGTVLVLICGSLATMAVGIVLAAVTAVVGHGEALARLILVALSFLSGTYFPVAGLPPVLRQVAAVLPTRIALDGLRAALAGAAWGSTALTLAGAAVLLVPLAVLAFGQAVRIAARRGVLTRA